MYWILHFCFHIQSLKYKYQIIIYISDINRVIILNRVHSTFIKSEKITLFFLNMICK